MLANAKHVKNVPGRKTDVNDATWLADLLAHGLIRGSFVPDAATQVLRSLLRTRKQLVREKSGHVQRLQKTFEEANIKLDSEISDIIGLTGRRMIEAIIAGETNPVTLAALADRRIKAAPDQLREALRGRVMPHHRFLLRQHLQQIDALDTAVGEIDGAVNERIAPFRTGVELLITSPGVSELNAQMILAEIGTDMSRFPTAAHFISWACMCPRKPSDDHVLGIAGDRGRAADIGRHRDRQQCQCGNAEVVLFGSVVILRSGAYWPASNRMHR